MDRSFKFTEKEVLLSGKIAWFHNFSSFGMNFRLNVERDFLKLTLLCNVTICTTNENGIFQKNSRPLDKVALRNLYEVELDGFRDFYFFFLYVAHTRCQWCNKCQKEINGCQEEKRRERNVILYYILEANYFMHDKTTHV